MAYKNPADRRAANARYRATHREAVLASGRETARKSYAANPGKFLARHAAWVKANPEKARLNSRLWRLAHQEEHCISVIAWRAANPERTRMTSAAYRTTHAGTIRANNAKRRARKAAASINNFTAAQWLEIQAAYDHRCVYCEKRRKEKLTQDHIIPLSKGGNHTWENIVPACRSCNSKKHTRAPLVAIQPLLFTIASSKEV